MHTAQSVLSSRGKEKVMACSFLFHGGSLDTQQLIIPPDFHVVNNLTSLKSFEINFFYLACHYHIFSSIFVSFEQ